MNKFILSSITVLTIYSAHGMMDGAPDQIRLARIIQQKSREPGKGDLRTHVLVQNAKNSNPDLWAMRDPAQGDEMGQQEEIAMMGLRVISDKRSDGRPMTPLPEREEMDISGAFADMNPIRQEDDQGQDIEDVNPSKRTRPDDDD